MTPLLPPPGWYANPSGEPGQRYWDGHRWLVISAPVERRSRLDASDKRAIAIAGGVVAGVLALVGGCAALIGATNSGSHPSNGSLSTSETAASQTIVVPTVTSTVAPPVPPTSPASVPFVGNPRCGESHDPSDESGDGSPPSSYLCAEKNYLHKLAGDNVVVNDPVAMIKAGYDIVCAIIGPSSIETPGSLDANGRDLGQDENAAQAAVLTSGVVTSPKDAQTVVSDAIIELC
jgi:hypothetical protein